jgi:hypothetical protein
MFKRILFASAMFIAGCAALFSVTGIAKLFVGAMWPAAIMASSLEIGKIVAVSFLYRFWSSMPKLLRVYLMIGTASLVIITSIGIYGYLFSAYASGASEIQAKQNQITLYLSQENLNKSQISQNTTRLENLQAIQHQQENRLDSLIQKGRSISVQQVLIRENNRQIAALQKDIQLAHQRLDSLELIKTNTTNSIATTGKIGTFSYVASALGVPLDTIVKWFILALVIVFDPMSVSLFLAYNIVDEKKIN